MLQSEEPKTSMTTPPSRGENVRKTTQKNGDWSKKYFLHGDSSDIVANVKNESHEYVESTGSASANAIAKKIHRISKEADQILNKRLALITSQEDTALKSIIQLQQTTIQEILSNASSQVKSYEEEYKKNIEEFITQLEKEMSKHLEALQRQVENQKQSVMTISSTYIQKLEIIVKDAKTDLTKNIQSRTTSKHQEILKNYQIPEIAHEPIGYEQLRKLTLEIYATTGTKGENQGGDNIPNRKQYLNEIQQAKKLPHPKRTVYIQSNTSSK